LSSTTDQSVSYYNLHGFVAFFFQPEAFYLCNCKLFIPYFSMGVNVLTLNKYMIINVTEETPVHDNYIKSCFSFWRLFLRKH